jgi:3-phenylpropionate/trans-cinnamate dioxygenase ferredoxin subunit
VLADGKLEGNTVACPKHGASFDVLTGKSTIGPKVFGFRGKTSDVKAFEVKVEGTDIFVKI